MIDGSLLFSVETLMRGGNRPRVAVRKVQERLRLKATPLGACHSYCECAQEAGDEETADRAWYGSRNVLGLGCYACADVCSAGRGAERVDFAVAAAAARIPRNAAPGFSCRSAGRVKD